MLKMFDIFWDLYPKKVNRHAASQEWIRIFEHGEFEFEDIMLGLEYARRSKSWVEDDDGHGRYIPSPVRWLEERRWMDRPTLCEAFVGIPIDVRKLIYSEGGIFQHD